jgi:hypothetical protein
VRWEREPHEIVGLFAATARPPLWRRLISVLPSLIADYLAHWDRR